MTSIEFAKAIRKKSLELVTQTKSSHIGGALSVADILAVAYTDILNVKPSEPKWNERDRLLFSKGHACTALYSSLWLRGFYSEEMLNTFTKNGSFFTSHVNHNVPGVELSTGSLGHALSVGCGIALAGKRKNKKWKTMVIVSDGELDEGSNWEAILFAPHHKLDNVTLIIDYNKIQSFGTTKEVLDLDPLDKKLESFGWETREIDGHNHDQIRQALSNRPSVQGKPFAVIAHTIKGKGVSFMENKLLWHYRSPSPEEYARAIAEIETILIPGHK